VVSALLFGRFITTICWTGIYVDSRKRLHVTKFN